MDFLEMFIRHVRVHLRRRDIGVAEESLLLVGTLLS